MRNQKGQTFVEVLFVLPLLLFLFTIIVEMGFIMYDFAVINYTATTIAVESSRQGYFTDDVYNRAADSLKNWTSNGEDLGICRTNVRADDPNSIVVWGPRAERQHDRGESITVGICYPVKFKTFIMSAVGEWTDQDNLLYLRSRAVSLSEEYFE